MKHISTKRIAAITMARNDEFFLNRWISYYGEQFGEENLYIYLDGLDQANPARAGRANITRLPHPTSGTKGRHPGSGRAEAGQPETDANKFAFARGLCVSLHCKNDCE